MKRLFYILCATAVMGCNQAQLPQTDLEKKNLKGNVHTVELKSYMDGSDINTSGSNAEGTPDQYMEFNTAGNLVVKKEFGNDGSLNTDTFIYNPKGQLVEQINTRQTSYYATHITIRKLYYDDEGKRIEDHSVFIEDLDSSFTHSNFVYNDKGQLLFINHNNENGPPSTNEFTYYRNGYTKSNRYFNKAMGTEFLTLYDESGWPIEKSYVGYRKTTYINNAQGEPEKITLSQPPVGFDCTYTYDAHGNWIMQEQLPDNTSYPHSRYTLLRTITYR